MGSRGIAKSTIPTLAICGLALAVATAASAQVVHTNPSGSRWYAEGDSIIYCGRVDPEKGNYVPCPDEGESHAAKEECQGFWRKGKCQWNRAVEGTKKAWEVLSNPGKAMDGFTEKFLSDDPQPQTMDSDPFASTYEGYQTPGAGILGRAVGRATARKAEQKRREKTQRRLLQQQEEAHRGLLSTLDRQERAKGTGNRSSYQATLGKTVLPAKSQGGTLRPKTGKKPSMSGATYDCRPGSSLYTPDACALRGFAPSTKPTKNYAVKPTDYSRKPHYQRGRRCGAAYGGVGYIQAPGSRTMCQ